MKKDEVILHQSIENRIYIIRGQKVMIDKDLAELYEIETKVFNQAVKRNIERFPVDFMFQLTENEYYNLRSQFVTSNEGRGGRRYLPMVFTEHGVLMLSSVLNSARAIQVNIEIMRIFTKIRQMITDNTELRLKIEQIKKKVNNHDKNIELVFSYLDELLKKKDEETSKPKIGFKTSD